MIAYKYFYIEKYYLFTNQVMENILYVWKNYNHSQWDFDNHFFTIEFIKLYKIKLKLGYYIQKTVTYAYLNMFFISPSIKFISMNIYLTCSFKFEMLVLGLIVFELQQFFIEKEE